MTLTGTTTPGPSRFGSNNNEGLLHTIQSSRTGASSLDAVQDTLFWPGLTPLQEIQFMYFKVGQSRKSGSCLTSWHHICYYFTH